MRFLPLSLISFFAAPVAGRLSARVPIRFLLGSGLALVALSLWLMSGISVDSDWTTLLAGFIVGGVGIGLVNAPLASTAVSTVRQERAGMASGINNTFRQLGIATGIAALGAIFQNKTGTSTFGTTGHLSLAAKSAFVSGLNSILVVGRGRGGDRRGARADPRTPAGLRRERPAAAGRLSNDRPSGRGVAALGVTEQAVVRDRLPRRGVGDELVEARRTPGSSSNAPIRTPIESG